MKKDEWTTKPVTVPPREAQHIDPEDLPDTTGELTEVEEVPEADPRPATMLQPVTFDDSDVEVEQADDEPDEDAEEEEAPKPVPVPKVLRWPAEELPYDHEAVLNARHSAADHAPQDRQHHGVWGPHRHGPR